MNYIDKDGGLVLQRAGEEKSLYCPYYSGDGSPSPCGDWCPLFGKPRESLATAEIKLDLCQSTLYFSEGEFEDRR